MTTIEQKQNEIIDFLQEVSEWSEDYSSTLHKIMAKKLLAALKAQSVEREETDEEVIASIFQHVKNKIQMENEIMLCKECGNPHYLRDSDAGTDREIGRLCNNCFKLVHPTSEVKEVSAGIKTFVLHQLDKRNEKRLGTWKWKDVMYHKPEITLSEAMIWMEQYHRDRIREELNLFLNHMRKFEYNFQSPITNNQIIFDYLKDN